MSTRKSLVFVLGLSLLILTGCQAMIYGTAARLDEISVGMTKEHALQKLGKPSSTQSFGDEELLIYHWMAAVISDWPKDYYVRIQDGKVAAYGRADTLVAEDSPLLRQTKKEWQAFKAFHQHKIDASEAALASMEVDLKAAPSEEKKAAYDKAYSNYQLLVKETQYELEHKRTELLSRLQTADAQERQANAQEQQQNQNAVLPLLLYQQQLNTSTPTYRPPIRCTSNRINNSVFTNCN